MKRTGIFLSLVLGVITLSANGQNYDRVDATILLYPNNFDSVESLSRMISRDFTTDEDKIRAMYSWIVQNISYDPEEYKVFDYKFKSYRERNKKEERTRENIIKRTLQKGIAVCEGYAMLFEKLCELQGITSYLVRGDTKTNFNDIGRPFAKNHMWNVAYIGGEPFLFDLTWGAGRYNGTFIKDPSYFYFKTTPKLFIRSHYPDMYEDAFLEEFISRQEFSNRPLLLDNELLLDHIETPKNGRIDTSEYLDAILFTLNRIDENEISYSFDEGNREPVTKIVDQGSVRFEVPLQLGVERLLIYFNNRPAIGYMIE